MNTGAPWPEPRQAEARVLRIQTKLHQWATDDPNRRFDDLFNLVYDPAFLLVAWDRVRGNRGARSAGVDGSDTPAPSWSARRGVPRRAASRPQGPDVPPAAGAGADDPQGGRQAPPPGDPTARDRVVQAALKLVLEPIFEADFKPCSYGFRPRRRAQDAIAEIHHFSLPLLRVGAGGRHRRRASTRSTTRPSWAGCEERIGDKRVLALVKAFLKAGILTEDGAATGHHHRHAPRGASSRRCWPTSRCRSSTSTSPRHGSAMGRHQRPSGRGGARVWQPTAWSATRTTSSSWWPGPARTPRRCGTRWQRGAPRRWACACRRRRRRSSHIDEGFDFLGFRIQRHAEARRPSGYVYTYPSKKALAAVKAKVRAMTRGARTNRSTSCCTG